MSIFNSIYNTQVQQIDFWREESTLSWKYPKSPIKYQGILTFKQQNSSNLTTQVNFSSKYLYYANNSNIYVSDISWSLIEGFKEESDTIRYGFRIKKSKTEILDFYTENSSELDEWIEALASVVVLQNFDDNYIIIKKIKEYWNSKIYLCQDLISMKNFTVKQVSKIQLLNYKELHLLYNEISIMRKLDHENIAKVFRVFEDESFVFIVMECLAFKSLEDWNLKLNKNDIILFSKQILNALSYLHCKKVMHRGLKADCIMIDSASEIINFKITGFRFSCIMNRSKPFKINKFEEFFSKGLNIRSLSYKKDIYDAGVVLLNLILLPNQKQKNSIWFRNSNNNDLSLKPIKKKVNKAGIDLISSLLSVNSSDRPTALEAIDHKWFDI